MEFLPTTLGTRPRLAVEVRAEGIVAARAEDAAAVLCAVSRAELGPGAVLPGLRVGGIADRERLVTAIRTVLDDVSGRREGGREGTHGRDVTLVVPDASVRVLLLDFDELPGKAVEALAVVRFRLKKLLPFDAEEARISYQVMSSAKGSVHVLAVAMPREVLEEYEALVLAAGYLPGAVLPSTLAELAGLEVTESPVLMVNICSTSLTAAIVKGGTLLLHRSVEMEFAADGVAPPSPDRMDVVSTMQSAVLHATEMYRAREGFSEEARGIEDAGSMEVAQAVSVAAAYFEDSLHASPGVVLAAGTVGAARLEEILVSSGLEDLRVRELMEPAMMLAGAVSAAVPRGWLAGVRGALKS